MMLEETGPDSDEVLKELNRLRLSITPEIADELLGLYRKVQILQLEVKRLSRVIHEVKTRSTLENDGGY